MPATYPNGCFGIEYRGDWYTLATVRLTSEQLSFLARFAKTPDGNAYLAILKARLRETESALRKQDGSELHRVQGDARTLDELINDLEDAHERLIRNAATKPSRPVVSSQREPR